ncbi:MAG: hypothetical protein KGN36_20355 [Acidobacteriota bacterium]|nr:hypothetical protein [Acidobacteriota bacterium]
MNRRLIAVCALCAAAARAAQPIQASLATGAPGCDGVAVMFKVEKAADFTPAVRDRLVAIWKWSDAAVKGDPAMAFSFSVQALDRERQAVALKRAEVMGGGAADWAPDPRHPETPFTPPRELKVCLIPRRALPDGALDARLVFAPPPGAGLPALPADLTEAITNPSLAGPAAPGAPGASTPAAKSFARELDLSGVVLSAVRDTTARGVTTRSRATKATFDLFLAPILRVRSMSYHDIGSSFVTFFTPIAIEAHASNQSITTDTLSQNRIVAGPEYELRWYARNKLGGISDNLLRLILSAKSTSDRDFKLMEPRVAAELRPVWGRANRPAVDPKSLKGTGHRRTAGEKIGRTLSPYIGVEEGRSYLRGILASAQTPLGGFTRGYVGGDLGIDFDGKFSLTTTQTAYVRGEAGNDWVHYMRSSGQWTFVSAPRIASAICVTFEKGRLPPFRSSVNALTFGIRVQSSNWGLGEPR